MITSALLKGCFTGASLIIAIGAQNAFVLKQGLLKNKVFITALFCTLVDAFLIGFGVGGLGKILSSNNLLLFIAKWGGSAFLFWYGWRSFRQIFKSQSIEIKNVSSAKPSLKETILILAAISFLNPHVYLDTVVLLGSIGSQYPSDEKRFFAIGAMLASLVWFFGLCYGARFLGPLFEKPKAWKILDFLIGCVMWSIALTLISPS